MSSTAIVAVFIPVVLSIAAKTNLNASRLLIPMSYAALISGMLTLIATTPNLVVSEELGNAGFERFNFFSFTPIGVAVLLVAIIFMVLVGRHLLPGERVSAPTSRARGIQDLLDEYKAEERSLELRVASDSPLVGRRLGDVELGSDYKAWVFIVVRRRRRGFDVTAAPGAQFELRAGDVLVLTVDEADRSRLEEEQGLEPVTASQSLVDRLGQDVGIAAVLVHPESGVIGKTAKEAEFRDRYGVLVGGVRHRGEALEDYLDHPLENGDALLVVGSWPNIGLLQSRPHDFVVLALPVEMSQVAPERPRAPLALGILGGMVALSALELVPVVVAVLMAALACVFTRCLTMEDAYRSIHWSSIVLIAGMLPIADALMQTGGVDLLVGALNAGMGDYGPYAMLTLLFFLSALLGLFLSNTATAILMAPIAIGAAEAMGVSPYAFVMTVAIAASAAFATPVSTPVVTLVVEPGNYRFMDFVKGGVPMVLLTWLVALLLIPLLFPY